MIDIRQLLDECENLGIDLSSKQAQLFDVYAGFLVEYNQKVNLTAITEPAQIVTKHFVDSLLLTKAVTLKDGASVADVGSGAGFPGVPVNLLRQDIRLTLIDSLNKRIVFLQELSRRLDVPFETAHLRAEEAGRNKSFREGFDVVTARAVAALSVLCEYCLPLCKVGGCFVALKGVTAEEELRESQQAITILGGELEQTKEYALSDGSKRQIICIRKKSQTPTNYPRISSKILKNPL